MYVILTGQPMDYSDELKRRQAELKVRALALEERTKRLTQARALELISSPDMSEQLTTAFRALRADLLAVQRDNYLLAADAILEQIEAEKKIPPGSAFDGVIVPDGVPPGGI